ncbi:TetR family transcriptional regulator [Frondihabitans sucicola]|uniref:TetR family transcriptional regulator n=1 Tax=Frondihabitans sucicola TaxID=1268041 RepID=A0ABM8GJQ4_9MICO|nr:TetR/AcrR family transcriptional regulator [Frondihabitans sucicola]BDZ48609.1 TetR family transcriptional regulator [Frondihabitans sucicola]
MTVITRGRPRGFDVDIALDRAIDVFWREGYDGASIAELTAAMSITATSLYAAFGSKRELFERAFTRYLTIDMAYAVRALEQDRLSDVFRDYLFDAVEAMTREGRPYGCMSVQIGGSKTGLSPAGNEIREFVSRARDTGYKRLTTRIEQGRDDEGFDLAGMTPAGIAEYLVSISNGIAVRAADGAERDELRGVVEIALRALITR